MSERTVDQELLTFASELLQERGALVESLPEGLAALLPESVAQRVGLPEEARLGGDDAPLLYGSPVLDRLIGMATEDIPVVYGSISVPYLKKEGFDKLIGKDIRFADGLARVGARAEARTTYMVLVCHYLAMSDERKEGLVQIGVHEGTGAVVEDLNTLWPAFNPSFFPSGKVPPHFPVHLEQAFSGAMRQARKETEKELSEFLLSMHRRLRRDIDNTREYYEALSSEMAAGLSHPNLTQTQKEERTAKIRELPGEMARKTEDLEQKYQVRVKVTARAALRFLTDVAQITLEFKYRKLGRSLRVSWNPITRSLDPLVCDQCQATTRLVYPASKDPQIQLLCPDCATKRKG